MKSVENYQVILGVEVITLEFLVDGLINDMGNVLMHSSSRFVLSAFVTVIFTVALISNAPVSGTVVEHSNDPLQLSNDEVKNSYLQYIKLVSQGQGQDVSDFECRPGLGNLETDDFLNDNVRCNRGLENQKDKLTNEELDDE